MTPETIAELNRLLDAATPEPIHWDDLYRVLRTEPHDDLAVSTVVAGGYCGECSNDDNCTIEWNRPEDRELFVLLRNNAKELIAAMERVKELEAWKQSVLGLCDHVVFSNALRHFANECFQIPGVYDGSISEECKRAFLETYRFVNSILAEAKEKL